MNKPRPSRYKRTFVALAAAFGLAAGSGAGMATSQLITAARDADRAAEARAARDQARAELPALPPMPPAPVLDPPRYSSDPGLEQYMRSMSSGPQPGMCSEGFAAVADPAACTMPATPAEPSEDPDVILFGHSIGNDPNAPGP